MKVLNLDDRQLANLEKLLARVDLKGAEAPMMMELLQMFFSKPPEIPVPPVEGQTENK